MRPSPPLPRILSRGLLPFALGFGAALAQPATTQPATPMTLAAIMADPDWIGAGVEQAWWSWDGQRAYYTRKRDGGDIRDTWAQGADGGDATQLDGAALAAIDGAQQVLDRARARMAFVRNGDIFVRDLASGALTQLTRSDARDTRPQWSRDGGLVWRAGNDWLRWNARDGVVQASNLKAAADPDAAPKADDLRVRQLHLIDTLQADKARREAARAQERARHRADATRAPLPVYLGKDVEIIDSALSPDARWLLVVTQKKGADAGQRGKLPNYITESGYEEFQEARTRVGRNAPLPQKLWLVDVDDARARELAVDALPGIADDPLAALRKAAKQAPLKGPRDVRIEADGDGDHPAIRWSDDSRNVALLVRAVDNKDRWIATLSPASAGFAGAGLQSRHRLHDQAWINWGFNDFGWLPDGSTLWLLSEQSGWSHLYLADNRNGRALTSGRWEVSSPTLAADGRSFYFICNRKWPGDYELCQVPVDGGEVRELTALDGVEGYALSPRGDKLLVAHSASYRPTGLAVANADGSGLRTLVDARKPAFAAIDWIQPQYVQVPSKHGAGRVWGKYYGPRQAEAGKRYPIVMFVHGAGYLQNASARYTPYFREQMFHDLLVRQGYIVLELDYRGSASYGRDWRTAIYRDMGHAELDDYLDGLDWLVAEKQGDRDRAGIYGGSYGGFLTFMALFRKPGVFKAGAALRPVSDWSQYNHEYTSNILNTPELDPEAYRRSSPLEYAAGLRDHLLIAHGMIDDNVFFKDSVLMTQKLIELRKDNWELAPYPLERHAFVHADSWYDEYRRIDALFEKTLKNP